MNLQPNYGLRNTIGPEQIRTTLGRHTFRDSLKNDPNIAPTLLNQLKIYKQTHLLRHHEIFKENKKNELALIESFSKIDFATVDFLHHHIFSKDNNIQANKVDPSKVKPLDLKRRVEFSQYTPIHKNMYKLNGSKLISQGKVAVVLVASDVMKTVDGNFTNISVSPMEETVKKACLLELFISKIKYIADKAIADFGKNHNMDREAIIIYVLTQSKDNDYIFSVMESESFYNYGGAFLFAQVGKCNTQKDLPAFSKDGHIRLSTEKDITFFANGHGGAFPAMKAAQMFEHIYQSFAFVSVENIHALPADPYLVGLAHEERSQVTLKVYGTKPTTDPANLPSTDPSYLIENDQGKPMRILKSELESGSLPQSELFHYTLNCVIRADALNSESFKKEFNYMMNYRFKKLLHDVYDTNSKIISETESFTPQIPFESAFSHFEKFLYSVERADEFIQIEDAASFAKAQRSYLAMQKSLLLANPKVRQLMHEQAVSEGDIGKLEAHTAAYFEYLDLSSVPFQRLERSRNPTGDFLLT